MSTDDGLPPNQQPHNPDVDPDPDEDAPSSSLFEKIVRTFALNLGNLSHPTERTPENEEKDPSK